MLRCVTKKHNILSHLSHSRQTSVTKIKEKSNIPEDCLPPFKHYRDSTSVLRALISCVKPSPETPHHFQAGEPGLGSFIQYRIQLLARAKGRLAARVAARDFFPNDIAGLAKEIPRVDHWIPIQTPNNILDCVAKGQLSNLEAMERLIILLAPKVAWQLYSEIAPEENWPSDTLHRLLDLLCATNGGMGGAYSHHLFDNYDWSSLPDPDELYFIDQLLTFSKFKTKFKKSAVQNELDSGVGDETGAETTGSNAPGDKALDEHHSTIWSLHGPSEQLFFKAQNHLNTPLAYRSMIRGACKFHNPTRAFELYNLICKSSSTHEPGTIDYSTYNCLIRALPELESIRLGKEDVWHRILKIVDQMKTNNISIDTTIYTSILYTLAEVTKYNKQLILDDKSQIINPKRNQFNFIPIGLGLMKELKSNNLQPELGAMANFLSLVSDTLTINNSNTITTTNNQDDTTATTTTSSRSSAGGNEASRDSKKTNSKFQFVTHDPSKILSDCLNELEDRFAQSSWTRFDSWGQDYPRFFLIAIKCAWLNNDRKLGQRIHNLLLGEQDRRYLFMTSENYYNYIKYYCLLMLNFNERSESVSEVIERFDLVFGFYKDQILTSIRLLNHLYQSYFMLFKSIYSDRKRTSHDETVDKLRPMVYASYSKIFRSYLNNFEKLTWSPVLQGIVRVLNRYAIYNPEEAFIVSKESLNYLEQTLSRLYSEASDGRINRGSVNEMINEQLDEESIGNLIGLLFPMFDKGEQMLNVVNLTENWIRFCLKYNRISFSWAPKALFILWKLDDPVQWDIIWDVIEQLKSVNCTQTKNESLELIIPLLDELEKRVITRTDSDSVSKLETVRNIRSKLNQIDSNDVGTENEKELNEKIDWND